MTIKFPAHKYTIIFCAFFEEEDKGRIGSLFRFQIHRCPLRGDWEIRPIQG